MRWTVVYCISRHVFVKSLQNEVMESSPLQLNPDETGASSSTEARRSFDDFLSRILPFVMVIVDGDLY